MKPRSPLFWRAVTTVLVALVVLSQLLWQHLHGGIVSHHLLHRADLPGISNAWGIVLLPALTWWLSGRIQRRLLAHQATSAGQTGSDITAVAFGFTAALAFGAFLVIAFEQRWPIDLGLVLLAIPVLAVLVPVHRAECVLGFVLAMSFGFGAVIATVVASVLALWSLALHQWLYPAVAKTWRRLGHERKPRDSMNRPG